MPDTATLIFLFGKLAAALALPPLGPLLLSAWGLTRLLRQRGRRGVSLLMAWGGLGLAVAASTPVVVDALLARLEPAEAISADTLTGCQAIVVLGGGRRTLAPEYGGDASVSPATLERLRYTARLARQSGLPVLVSGGAPSGGTPEAVLMREVLEMDFGVPVRWMESESRDTAENARYAATLLRAEGIARVAVVTHAAHMPRALRAFAATGLEAAGAPTGWLRRDRNPPGLIAQLPSAGSAYAGWFALHEMVGDLVYRLRHAPPP